MELNLALDVLGSRVNKNHDLIYGNATALSQDRKIPLNILRRAKKNGSPGFRSNTTEVNWSKLQPYLVANYSTLEKEVEEAENIKSKNAPVDLKREKLELQKLREEVIKLRNYNRRQDADFISRRLVTSTLERLVKELSTSATRIFADEQPVKCAGMATDEMQKHNNTFLDQLFAAMLSTLKEWQETKDLTTLINDGDGTTTGLADDN